VKKIRYPVCWSSTTILWPLCRSPYVSWQWSLICGVKTRFVLK